MPIVVAHVIVGYLVATTGAAIYLHAQTHAVNATQIFLAFFCSLNALICFWELALAYKVDIIKKKGDELRARAEGAPHMLQGADGLLRIARRSPAGPLCTVSKSVLHILYRVKKCLDTLCSVRKFLTHVLRASCSRTREEIVEFVHVL